MIASNYFNAQSFQTPDNKSKTSSNLNFNTYLIERQNLIQLYCARFDWSSPSLLSTKYIENMLLHFGLAAIYETKSGWLIRPAVVKEFTLWGEPLTVTAYQSTTQTIDLNVLDGRVVLIKDNQAGNSPIKIIEHYSRLIADVSRSCEVYAKGLKKPLILEGKIESEKSRKQIVSNIHDNESYIVIDSNAIKDLTSGLSVHQNSSHNAGDLKGLEMFKNSLFHECLARLGLTTPSELKKVQLTEDEVNKNDVFSNIIIGDSYKCREEATKKLYELSEIELTCELPPDLNNAVANYSENDGGESDERV